MSECDDGVDDVWKQRRDEEQQAAQQVLGTCAVAAASTATPRSTFHAALINTLTSATKVRVCM